MKRMITLMRHGWVDGPAALYGHTDISLSSDGENLLRTAINRVHERHPINRIVCSPLVRCAQLANEFATALDVPLEVMSDLKEIHFGEWDGIPFDNFSEEQWRSLASFWEAPINARPPQGESLQIFATRVIHSWQHIQNEHSAPHQLVLCHGGVIRIIIAHLLNLDWANPALFRQLTIDYASHTLIEIPDHPDALPVIRHIGEAIQA